MCILTITTNATCKHHSQRITLCALLRKAEPEACEKVQVDHVLESGRCARCKDFLPEEESESGRRLRMASAVRWEIMAMLKG